MLTTKEATVSSSVQSRVSVTGLHKAYGDRKNTVRALKGVDLRVEPGKMVVLLGPSGCGKTTLLRCVAGLEQAEAGHIEVDSVTVFSAEPKVWVPPERRGLSMVFQSYALWPHMTVFEQVAYPLQCRKVPKSAIQRRVTDALDVVGLGQYAKRLPGQLSGGQQQRVALARAVVAETGLVLFDEPLSNVDAKVREQVRHEIVTMQRRLGFAGVYVTHDQVEAGALADELVVMDEGHIVQSGTPQQVYERPDTRYVANFVGVANELVGAFEPLDSGTASIDSPYGRVVGVRPSPRRPADDRAVAVFRPEAAQLHDRGRPDGPNVWRCTVERRMFMGAHTDHLVVVAGSGVEPKQVVVRCERGRLLEEGAQAWLRVPTDDVRILDE